MHNTRYLYGIDPRDLIGMEYIQALHYKKEKGLKLYGKLWKMHSKSEEIQHRLFHVGKANEFTNKLIEELE